ncbi:hypothetical protein [Alloalcanivorax balearicus]|uniref:hypothetical protein n=1 Tax=Alloalcanivorax balearicus TaxID=413232 RepID=UPI0021CD9990|nr:hypothetical protein [Alloalcanivorax balearicus]
MSTKILKTSMLALAGAVALAAAGSASAMSPPYAMCTFKGETQLTSGVGATSCWLTLAAKVNCDGDVEIVAAGPVEGDATCTDIFVGNFPWFGTTAGIIAGGTINTDFVATGNPSVIHVSGLPLAGGTLTGVGPATSTMGVACDAGSTVTVPTVVPVNGMFSGPPTAAFQANGLQNLGCSLVL